MSGTLKDMQEGAAKTPRAVLIAGPTASGKSALALKLAERQNGVIVNADSMQLYKELRLVSARPSREEESRVPHRLYGVISAARQFSTGAWLDLVGAEINRIEQEGKLPVIVGGTGLYFKALTEGLAIIPEIPDEIRAACRLLADAKGVDGVRERLVSKDPLAAEKLIDLQRLTRALEVVEATGRPLAVWQRDAQSSALLRLVDCRSFVLGPPRPWLHARIAQRASLMLSETGEAEVRALLEMSLPKSLPAMRAIGVREIADLLRGTTDREQALHHLTVATRRYAKRQETWFRNQMPKWPRVDPTDTVALETASNQ
ncbi:tRNA (adenosine(37)-N6)-dimethylallyltransferase MiaA [Roseibium sp.]|uniref:tRNA (adenosine(37)-N6)-dimethylallyltransferase MiaA n=1 Tax=Roseibium sp. TaxID=1936156 RepID=UPI003A97E3C5